jgi:hypothetical protein
LQKTYNRVIEENKAILFHFISGFNSHKFEILRKRYAGLTKAYFRTWKMRKKLACLTRKYVGWNVI